MTMIAGSPPPCGAGSSDSTNTVSIFGTQEKRGKFVSIEIRVQDFPSLKMDFFRQSITQTHGDAAFHLYPGTFGINHQTHILSAYDAFYLGGPFFLIDRKFSDGGDIGSGVGAAGHAVTALTGRPGRNPAEAFGSGF